MPTWSKLESDIYRPWICEERNSHLTDLEILQSFSEQPLTPFGIAGGNNRISTVRIQCHYLNQLGYLNQTSVDTYTTTMIGDRAITNNEIFNEEGYVRLKEELKLDYEHVTDLGELLHADTLIEINKQFFEAEQTEYEGRTGTLHEIESVRDSRLERLTTEFPRFEPLTNQLAHTVRTFCGHHLFPDANHRTGTHVATILADKQGHDLFTLLQEDPDGIRRAVEISKLLRGICSNIRNSVDYLWLKDELFHHWNRYFRDLLYDLDPQKRVHPKTGSCQYDNLTSNDVVRLIYRFATLPVEDMRKTLDKEGGYSESDS